MQCDLVIAAGVGVELPSPYFFSGERPAIYWLETFHAYYVS